MLASSAAWAAWIDANDDTGGLLGDPTKGGVGGLAAETNGTPGVKADAVERRTGGRGVGAGGGELASATKLDGGEPGKPAPADKA